MKPTYYILDRNILVVATMLPDVDQGYWGAYIGVVAGRDHSSEYREVLASGTKVREKLARVIFPEFEKIPYGF